MFPLVSTANSAVYTRTSRPVRFQSSAIQQPENHAAVLEDAVVLHSRRPLRSGEETPYFAHQEGVESLIFKHGGNESEAVAGLFHDGIEKDGSHWGGSNKAEMLAGLTRKYGDQVANLVLESTDPSGLTGNDKKAAKALLMIRHPELSTPGGRLVKMADLLDNLQAIHSSLTSKGLERTFQSFRGIDGPNPVVNSYKDYILLTKAFLTLEGVEPKTKAGLQAKIRAHQQDADPRNNYRLTLLLNFIEAVEKYYDLTANQVLGVKAIGPLEQVLEHSPTYEEILEKFGLLDTAEANYLGVYREVMNLRNVIAANKRPNNVFA